MDAYDPAHICNHTDQQGRYAFARQPGVAHWNLHALGQALTALLDDADAILAILQTFPDQFEQAWIGQIRLKLGLTQADVRDLAQMHELYRWMAEAACDHTIFWRRLSHCVLNWQAGVPPDQAFVPVIALSRNVPRLSAWLDWLRQRLSDEARADAGQRMMRHNPQFVLRNHLAELAIRAAQAGDFQPVRQLLGVLQNPYDDHPEHQAWADFPPAWSQHLEISCSS
jgi:uncharacterized protein YdiU (UPF0061 family)